MAFAGQEPVVLRIARETNRRVLDQVLRRHERCLPQHGLRERLKRATAYSGVLVSLDGGVAPRR
jgi:hypothetical protein